MRKVAVLVGISAAVRTSSAEQAAPEEQSYGWDRRFAIALHVGVRSPLGVGVAYEVSPVTALALEGGIGKGSEGTQLAFAARARVRARSVAISAGAGFSAGPFRADNVDCQLLLTLGCTGVGPTQIWTWDRAVWRNIEFSIERRSSFGLHWRFYGGVGTILNPTDAACTAPYPGVPHAPCKVTAFSSAYYGTSLGYAF